MDQIEINLDAIRISQNFAEDVAVKRKITVIPITKPNRNWWTHVHTDPSFSIDTMLLEDGEDKQLYLVPPELHSQLSDEAKIYRLHTAITRQGDLFLWPIKLPSNNGSHPRMDRYFQSVTEAISRAREEWVRIKWNKSQGTYDTLRTERKLPDPEWPEESFQEIINIAFKGFLITGMDHPAVERLLHGR